MKFPSVRLQSIVLFLLLAAAPSLTFQNCSFNKPVEFGSRSKGGNSEGYQGKTYILADSQKECTDGDSAKARIATSKDGTRYALVREACANVAAKPLGAGDVLHPDPAVAQADYVIYQAQRYDYEQGSNDLKLAKLALSGSVSYEAPGASDAPVSGGSLGGMGYNKPSVIERAGSLYTTALYPCTMVETSKNCFRVMSNLPLPAGGSAQPFSAQLNMAAQFAPPLRADVQFANEAPLLFARGDELIAAYTVTFSDFSSEVRVARTNFSNPAAWTLVAATATTQNMHLGGALAPDGTIYLAANVGTQTDGVLGLFRLQPGLSNLEFKAQPALPQGVNVNFPQVSVDASGRLHVVATYGHDECAGYRSMRNVVELTGQWSDPSLREVWSENSADYSNGAAQVPPVCGYDTFRFASDVVQGGNTLYTLIHANNPNPGGGPYLTANSLVVSTAGGVNKIDLTPVLSLVNAGSYNYLSVTWINGEIVIVGGFGQSVAVTTSKDLINFAGPFVFNAPYGPDSQVKLNQPAKNGSDGSRLYLWHAGGGANNDFLRYQGLDLK